MYCVIGLFNELNNIKNLIDLVFFFNILTLSFFLQCYNMIEK